MKDEMKDWVETAAKSPSDGIQAGKDAGKDMCERVCRKMGIEPEVYEGPHGKSHDRQYVSPNLLTDEWAGKLLAMLAARGVEYELVHSILHNLTPESGNFGIRILPKRIDYCAETLPEAICRAIDSMPEADHA